MDLSFVCGCIPAIKFFALDPQGAAINHFGGNPICSVVHIAMNTKPWLENNPKVEETHEGSTCSMIWTHSSYLTQCEQKTSQSLAIDGIFLINPGSNQNFAPWLKILTQEKSQSQHSQLNLKVVIK